MRGTLVLVGALAAACAPTAGGPESDVDAGVEDDGGSPELTFQRISADVIGPRCSGPTCHSDGNVLSFTKRRAVVDADARSVECGGVAKIAVPFRPGESLIYTKLTSPPCGGMMPFAIEPLDADSIEKIRRWIEIGAP